MPNKYKVVDHRVVVNSKKERFYYPFFLTTSHRNTVKPAEELVSEQNPAKYKTFNFGKYMVISFVVILANKRLKLTEFLTLRFLISY
jgi:isopenicillin N synthase-like dioxygenase